MANTEAEVLRVDNYVGAGAAKDEFIRRLKIEHTVCGHCYNQVRLFLGREPRGGLRDKPNEVVFERFHFFCESA